MSGLTTDLCLGSGAGSKKRISHEMTSDGLCFIMDPFEVESQLQLSEMHRECRICMDSFEREDN